MFTGICLHSGLLTASSSHRVILSHKSFCSIMGDSQYLSFDKNQSSLETFWLYWCLGEKERHSCNEMGCEPFSENLNNYVLFPPVVGKVKHITCSYFINHNTMCRHLSNIIVYLYRHRTCHYNDENRYGLTRTLH